MPLTFKYWIWVKFWLTFSIGIHKWNDFADAFIYFGEYIGDWGGDAFLERMFDFKEHIDNFLEWVASHHLLN